MKAVLPLYKYVDDITTFETCDYNTVTTKMDNTVVSIVDWCKSNKMIINPLKTKEMLISFSMVDPIVSEIIINGVVIERVDCTKLLGLFVSSDLTWKVHVNYVCTKANQRLFCIRLLKRANVSMDKIISVYCASIRSILEYACQVFHGHLNKELTSQLESIQERALKIIMPDAEYELALQISGLKTLEERRTELCKKLFQEIQSPEHRLHHLLPDVKDADWDRRAGSKYPLPIAKTKRARNSFINYCLYNLQ